MPLYHGGLIYHGYHYLTGRKKAEQTSIEDHTFLTFAPFFSSEEHASTKCYSYISYIGSQAVFQFPRVLAQAGILSFLFNPIQPYLQSEEFRWLMAACLNPKQSN